MGRTLHFELSTGASGDKILGALLEVCEAMGAARFEDLERLGKALVPNVRIMRTQVVRSSIAATSLEIAEPEAPVRHWGEIRELIETATKSGVLPATAGARALAAFELVALAEAAVHDQPLEQVHFHEVGAADSILDIVGSCFLFDALAPEAVYATPLALGFGSFECAHGTLPVPAPATARIIEGLPVYAGAIEGELTTPTGAALIRSFVTHFEPLPCVAVQKVGYGAGSRKFAGAANVVRLLLGKRVSDTADVLDSPKAALFAREGCVLLETNIDHRSPEALSYICEELLDSGALDVWQEAITMKKGRLAVKLCVLCHPSASALLAQSIITKTGSLGVRQRFVERLVAPRHCITLDTPYGSVPFKLARFADNGEGEVWIRPEHDAVRDLAHKHQLDYQTLYDELVEHAVRSAT
ncbi:MAG: nickel pincer cofactor biosynthesis protein LarC [Coriobacteriales bacterium]|jgi:uncharacterized protein (TIGR00299 family) protein|nr:nickel pincer cofactor biosynthesis protein LarC [Coriobacteriales bacterium]